MGRYLRKIGIPELISHTTRQIRVGETEGISYYFVNKEEFDSIEKIEYSNYAGNYYCLSKKEVEDKLSKYDKVFAITDYHGVEQIKQIYPDITTTIFIDVTYDDMIKRMKNRGDKKEDIAKRIYNSIMTDEKENKHKCDFIVENNNLDRACAFLSYICCK